MCDLLIVAVVEALHELLEEVPGFCFGECAGIGNEVEQLAALSALHNNVGDHFIISLWLLVECGADFHLLDDVGVLQLVMQIEEYILNLHVDLRVIRFWS